MNEPRVNIPEWSVSELAAALKKTVEDSYGFVRVRGEITGYRGPHSSGVARLERQRKPGVYPRAKPAPHFP